MSIYGYIRRKESELLVNQLKVVQAFQCAEIFIETEMEVEECVLSKLIWETLAEGDTLVMTDLTTIGKSFFEMSEYFEIMAQKNIRLIAVNNQLDTQTNEWSNFYQVALLLGELDRHAQLTELKKTRSQERLTLSTHSGRPRLSSIKIDKIRLLHSKGMYTLREIAEICEVSVGTVYKYTHED